MLTQVSLEDVEGNVVVRVDTMLREDWLRGDPDAWRGQAVLWNGRLFCATVNIPDCDAPENYIRCFEEVPVVVVEGNKQTLISRLIKLVREGK
jgi:hypothetical protein